MAPFLRNGSIGATILILAFSTTTLAASNTAIKIAAEYADVLDYVKENYAGSISYDDMVDNAYWGLFGNLDEYSGYLSPAEAKSLMNSKSENQFGIGMQADFYPKICKVIKVFEGGAAHRAGILAGDEITYINGMPYSGYEQFDKILSKPVGTTVRLAVNRDGKQIIFEMKTENYTVPSLYTKDLKDMLNSENAKGTESIRYMKIEGFDEGVSKSFDAALNKGKVDGISTFIVDLRGNPGGSLEEIMLMFDKFIPKSDVVKIVFKSGEPMMLGSTYNGKTSPFKFVVITDSESASASELFAATIKEKGVGKVVGQTTFGKGVGQDWITLSNGGLMVLTTFEYRTAKDTKVNKVGVTPDVEVKAPRYFEGSFNLENNSHVSKLNQILRYVGYKTTNYLNDYSDQTKAAVTDIQKKFKLYDTGYVGDYEIIALNSLLKQKLEPTDKNNDVFLKAAIEVAKTLK